LKNFWRHVIRLHILSNYHNNFTVPAFVDMNSWFHFFLIFFLPVLSLFYSFIKSSAIIFARPKSITFRNFELSVGNIKFSGLRSLWQIPFEWKYLTACTIYLKKSLAFLSEKVVCYSSPSNKSPPLQSLKMWGYIKKSNTPLQYKCKFRPQKPDIALLYLDDPLSI